MSGIKFVRSLAVVAAAFVVTGAFAAGQMDLLVSAEVKGTCRLITVDPLDFTLDPAAGGDHTLPSVVTYRCTKGTAAPTLKIGGATGGTYNTGTLTNVNGFSIPFEVTWANPSDPGLGLGTTGDQTVTLSGKIVEASYLDVPAAVYTKTVVVEISP